VYDSEVASENFTPLDELKYLDSRIDPTQALEQLLPVFQRVEEIVRKYPGDFEIQLVAHDVKQHVLAHGSKLRQMRPAAAIMPDLAAPDAAAPAPIMASSTAPPPIAQAPPAPTAAEPATPTVPKKSRRGIVFAWIAAGIVLLGGGIFAVSTMQERSARIAAQTAVDAHINTVPAGAAVQINGQQTCVSDCVVKLAPGTALLDGYSATSGQIKVEPVKGATLGLTLTPQPVNVRVVAELAQGRVFLDDQPAGELQDGQWSRAGMEPGVHTLRVTGGNSEAVITFQIAAAAMPVIQGPMVTKNLLATAVTNVGTRARLATSTGPLKLALNGTAQADASPEGVDLAGYTTGSHEIALGEGTSQKKLAETFDAAPGLTVFLKTDQNLGTLLITTGQDDVRVFVNDREQKQATKKGELRVQTIGKVTVRVEKAGFEATAAQTATVVKGEAAKLTFAMKELPKVAILAITGGAAGTQVVLDQRVIGAIGADGTYRNTAVAPGDHTVELRRDQFETKRLTRAFRAGQTVTIAGNDAVLTAVRVAPPPPPPPVAKPKPEPEAVKPPAPKPLIAGMTAFDKPGEWREQQGIWRHRGAADLTFGVAPNGIFTFSIYMLKAGLFRGRVRWFLNYTDAKNYSLFELDEENFWSKVVQNGKTLERKKVAHKQDKDMRVWNIQIDVNASRAIHKIQSNEGWVDLDTWSEPGRDFTRGKFGIQVNGNDEVGLSNFQFTGR
jgi:hypothetical protein